MLYLSLWLSLIFALAIPGSVLARMPIIDGSANSRPAVIIVASVACTYLIVTYSALFGLPAFAAFLCVMVLAGLAILYDVVKPREAVAHIYSLRALAAGLIAGVILIGCFWVFWRQTPAVFLGSDTVASWNTWAREWAAGRIPALAYGYPQLAPAIWGSTYVWLGDSIQYGPTYLFVLLLILPPAASAMWSGERNPILALWMVGIYGAFVVHFRGWLGGTLLASFPDWLVVSFVASAMVIAGPRLLDPSSRQSDDSLALTTAQIYLCAAASIKPLAGLLSLAVLVSTALLRFRSSRTDLNRSVVVQLFAIGLAVATFMAYYVQVRNAVVLPAPRPATFAGQLVYGAEFVGKAVFPVFLFLSVWGLGATAFNPSVWPLSVACAGGFAIWARTASYDLRNVLPFVIASTLLGVCVVAKTMRDRGILQTLAERLVLPADRKIPVPPVVTLLAFALVVLIATLPLMKSDDDIRRSFLRDNQAIGLGTQINTMVIAAAKDGCWIGTNNSDLFYQHAMEKLPGKRLVGFSPIKVDEIDLRPVLSNSCSAIVILAPTLTEAARQLLASQEAVGRLRRASKLDWLIYASPGRFDPDE
ncbi:hypothetical protein [Bradyrhizobium sp.]|uniref:hypothetical protein n=1 Tax=Bradyrhizobium sp. TaxID=376 RepID=UPI001D8A9BFC|nr:hypothetical protein [Bradyrhizobium sp.]MBI5322702.1 hypothetical protein [Bradyrhizobium sp.]